MLANLTVKELHVSRSYELIAWLDDQRGPGEVVVPRAASLDADSRLSKYLVMLFVRCALSNKMKDVIDPSRLASSIEKSG